ncbi:MAG TPA: DUF4388 domain-containing protein [bacterium]|nr:DUF4388 domain-containing protein [bacterium]
MRGTTGGISVAGMLRLLCGHGRTGALNIENAGRSGSILIKNGAITGVTGEGEKGGEDAAGRAVSLLLMIEGASFHFDSSAAVPDAELDLCAEALILESSRRYEGPEAALRDYLPPENEVLKPAGFSKGKKIKVVFTDNEWNTLILINGDNTLGEVISRAGGGVRAAAAVYGLIAAGLVRRSRFKIPGIKNIARAELGNIGAAIVDSAFSGLKTDRAGMGMKEFISLLNELENSFSAIVGKTRAKALTEKIWEETK